LKIRIRIHHQQKNTKKTNEKGSRRSNNSSKREVDNRKFPDHYIKEVVDHAMNNGVLISGTLRIHTKNFEEAYVSSPDGGTDFSIQGIRNRNRALHGDLVAIDIFPESEWRINMERLRDFAMLNALNAGENGEKVDEIESLVKDVEDIELKDEKSKVVAEDDTKMDQVKVQANHARSNSFNECDIKSIQELKKHYPDQWQEFIQKTARVVAILEAKHSRCSAGYLKLFQDKNPNFALFSPIDSRFPRLKIAKVNCPKDFFARPQDFQEFLYIGKIIQWDLIPFGVGLLTHNLGSDKDIDVRTKGILLENGIDFVENFNPGIEDSLPSLPFVIPSEEIEKRRDYRKNCVFTIDPLTARDLDDALSIEKMENGNFKVGVHIADVSYFVTANTKLDEEAEHRATSVYLVQQVIPMLPRTLCENLCSLNPSLDRLTFSAEWVISPEAEILDIWFGRSVICSATKLAYEHAQDMLENPDKKWTDDELPPISQPWTASDISKKSQHVTKVGSSTKSQTFRKWIFEIRSG